MSLSFNAAFSQSNIKGIVEDTLGQPVTFANVLLLHPADSSLAKGMVTDAMGVFQFEQVNAGTYLLKASRIGHEDYYLPSLEINSEIRPLILEKIILKTSSEELEEVVVQAEKALFEMQIDRMVVNVQSSITASSGTVLDVLERSPGVKVDHYNSSVSMNSKNGVQVMINGKLNRMPMEALYQMLGSMQAVSVDKVELITTPPANMDAEGNAGFINIVLLQNEGNGMNGSFFINAEKRRRFNSAFGGDINIRKNRFHLFFSHSFTYNRRLAYVNIDRVITYPENLFELNSHVNRIGGFDTHDLRLGIDYEVTNKTIVGILTSMNDRNWSQVTDMYADYKFSRGIDSLMNGMRRDQNPSDQFMFNFNLKHFFTAKQLLNLDLDYFYYYSYQPQNYIYNFFREENIIGRNEIRISRKTPMDIWVGKLDYTFASKENFTFESGLKITYSGFFNNVLFENKEDVDWVKDPMFSETAAMDEMVSAAYSSFSLQINESDQLKLGLRYEHTDTKLTSENSAPIHRKYGSFFPTLFYSNKVSENSTLQFAVNRRINRPSFSELAPTVFFLDPVTFVTGNSFLWPALTNTVKTDFSHKGIIFSFQTSRTRNAIYRFQPQSDSNSNVTTYSSLNIAREQGYVFNLTLPLTPTPWWEIQNNLQGMYQKVKTRLNEVPYESSQYSFSINSSHTFQLPKNLAMELSGFFNSPSINGIRKVMSSGSLNIGLSKEFNNNGGKLNLSFSDVFRTQIIQWKTDIPEQHLTDLFVFDMDNKGVKLTYNRNFGNQKVKKARKRDTGSTEEQKRF